MSKVSKLRNKVRRLKRENLALIIEANQARVRAAEASEAAVGTAAWLDSDGHLHVFDGYSKQKLDS